MKPRQSFCGRIAGAWLSAWYTLGDCTGDAFLVLSIDCSEGFFTTMSCLFYRNAFCLIATIPGIRYSFPFLMPLLVSVLQVPDFLPPSLVASRETFLLLQCLSLV